VRLRWGRVGALLGSLAAVGCAPPVTDIGYVGTWQRGGGTVRSTLAIRREGAGYAAQWRLRSADGRRRVDCTWEGRCEEMVDGRLAARHELLASVEPGTGRLVLDWHTVVLRPQAAELRSRDVLDVEPGGRVLTSYTVRRNGQTFEGDARPKRSFDKITDEVPPARARR
jgi:hypothetical protein